MSHLRRGAITAASAVALLGLAASPSSAATDVIYDAVPSPLPASLPSVGYQASQTSEFGDHVAFAGGARDLESVSVTMVSWACESGAWYTEDCDTSAGATFTHPVTVNLYAVASDENGNPVPGDLIATETQDVEAPYRPSGDAACDNGGWGEDCSNGFAFDATFDFTGTSVPDEVIYGIAFDTSSYGDEPIGATGPYDALNVGVVEPEDVTAGEDVEADVMFRDVDGGGFAREAGWSGYAIPARFTAAYTAEDCKKGGYEDLGFRNQGECVSSDMANPRARR